MCSEWLMKSKYSMPYKLLRNFYLWCFMLVFPFLLRIAMCMIHGKYCNILYLFMHIYLHIAWNLKDEEIYKCFVSALICTCLVKILNVLVLHCYCDRECFVFYMESHPLDFSLPNISSSIDCRVFHMIFIQISFYSPRLLKHLQSIVSMMKNNRCDHNLCLGRNSCKC